VSSGQRRDIPQALQPAQLARQFLRGLADGADEGGAPAANVLRFAAGEPGLAMKHGETKPIRLEVWGDCLLNQLSARTRKRRKREASKKRRVVLGRDPS